MPHRRVPFSPSQYYHVFNRGFCKMPIFSNRKVDAYYFIKKALKLSEKYNVFIESQAIMLNHFHFILLQNEENTGIQRMLYILQMSFAAYYNRKYGRRGQVFEGRYNAKLIADDKYYFDVTNYVFKNPIN